MSRKRLSMRKIKQVLRLKWKAGLGDRPIARACRMGRATVQEYLHRAEAAGLYWERVREMDEAEIEARLFPDSGKKRPDRRLPDWTKIREELGKKKSVTLRLLWEEYYGVDPGKAYSYSQFCQLYKSWSGKLPASMVQVYRGGEYLFVDYAGQTVPHIDRFTGEEKRAQIFVAALGASSFTYAEAQEGQDLASWTSGHVNAFEYIDGVPAIVVPDNLKSGVKSPCYYEPDVNPTYDDLSLHYGFAVIPARVRKPRDKAKVEAAVQVVERWVLAPLRKRRFFGIGEINEAMRPLLERVNDRLMEHFGKSRRELFESLDRPALKALPEHSFEYAERKQATVGLNYHVTFNKHYYSVPYTLIGKAVEIRATARTIEIFSRGKRVASHLRDDTPGKYTTDPSHMPSNHRRRMERWSPERFIRWARKMGPWTCQVIEGLLGRKRHPEQAYRSCLGVLKLADKYGDERLEAACQRAVRFELYAYGHIRNILRNNMDRPDYSRKEPRATATHQYVRGGQYYH
jgi:transposase